MNIEKINNKLKPCPFCRVTIESLNEHMERNGTKWEHYRPQIFFDNFVSKSWVIYCNNCGITLITGCEDINEAIITWNNRG